MVKTCEECGLQADRQCLVCDRLICAAHARNGIVRNEGWGDPDAVAKVIDIWLPADGQVLLRRARQQWGDKWVCPACMRAAEQRAIDQYEALAAASPPADVGSDPLAKIAWLYSPAGHSLLGSMVQAGKVNVRWDDAHARVLRDAGGQEALAERAEERALRLPVVTWTETKRFRAKSLTTHLAFTWRQADFGGERGPMTVSGSDLAIDDFRQWWVINRGETRVSFKPTSRPSTMDFVLQVFQRARDAQVDPH